ncbi:nudix hydrolase, putative [Ichthyophthirius multifiliis]|uniref:Nudix hydrolase, putative n=1 Tax=Ichthyophthirius multifiliis TaxID=5932 RepID=G0R647_ICHMU|nr:nudix hydrolase, putative [Ichthyophthirius multifiliis]EGR27070.1 nudix hydrolase, putative [Ichthyophthirius multifiliis]|eukprot:XP_004023954.1 nudix hydrolase, putative [Ichthyophthirius multifiliis]
MGCFALPGGHVEYGEDPQICVLRELEEECQIVGNNPKLYDVRGKPDRDVRYHVVSIIYWVEIDNNSEPKAADDAASASFYDIDLVKKITKEKFAFDHYEMLQEIIQIVEKQQ